MGRTTQSTQRGHEDFDRIADLPIATLRHPPLAPAPRKMGGALRPGGTLVVLDLHRARSPADHSVCAAGFPASKAIRLAKTGAPSGPRRSPELRQAWEKHWKTDRLPTLAEVRRACTEAGVRGARVRRRLLWRCSLVWRKPAR